LEIESRKALLSVKKACNAERGVYPLAQSNRAPPQPPNSEGV
jgi:hypothetical protein